MYSSDPKGLPDLKIAPKAIPLALRDGGSLAARRIEDVLRLERGGVEMRGLYRKTGLGLWGIAIPNGIVQCRTLVASRIQDIATKQEKDGNYSRTFHAAKV